MIAGYIGHERRQLFETVIQNEEEQKLNFVQGKDEAMLFHKGNRGKEEQLQKIVESEASSKRITFESDSIEDDEQHSGAMPIKCEEQIKLLKKLMREPECEEKDIVSGEKCSQVTEKVKMSQVTIKIEKYFSFQTSNFIIGTE